MIKFIFLFCFFAAVLFGCGQDNNPMATSSDQIVVRAYLYADEEVDDIQLTSTVSLDADTDTAPPINDAQVTLIKNGQRFELSPSPGDSGYYHYVGSDLTVSIGDRFAIEITHQGQLITAQTVVPVALEVVTLSSAEMIVPSPGTFGRGNFPDFKTLTITVNWENSNGELFFITVENVEADPQPIETRF